MTADGIPIVGYTDYISLERAPADDEAIRRDDAYDETELIDGAQFYRDPPGTVEIGDWKFPSNERGSERDFSLGEHELPDDIQLVTYGEWAARTAPALTHARLSLIYTTTKRRPTAWKVSALVERERIGRRWEYVEAVVRTIKDVARETDLERIPGNPAACDSFGGCPYRESCSVGKSAALDDFFGTTGSAGFLNSLGAIPMGVLDGLNLPPPAVAASPTGVAAILNISAAVPAAPAAPEWPVIAPSREFSDAVATIVGKGYGFPHLTGDAAAMYRGFSAEPARKHADGKGGITGYGQLAGIAPVSDPARLAGIAQELAGVPVNPSPAVRPEPVAAHAAPAPVVLSPTPAPAPPAPVNLGILPPDAPASKPELAAKPVEGFAPVGAVTPGVQIPGLIASVPPAAAAPILAANAPAVASDAGLPATPPASPAPRARRGRPPGTGKNAAKGAETMPGGGSYLFVDCEPNIPTTDLAPIIDSWAVAMAKHFRCEPVDIRCAPKDTPIAYGGWKGGMCATARKAIRGLAEGAYHLHAEGNEIYLAALEGLVMARVSDDEDADTVFSLVVRG